MDVSPRRKENLFERIGSCQCNVCGYTPEELGQEKHYAYLAGHYCSSECYDTLFGVCTECTKKNMTVVTNAEDGKGEICDACYMEQHDLTVVTIGC